MTGGILFLPLALSIFLCLSLAHNLYHFVFFSYYLFISISLHLFHFVSLYFPLCFSLSLLSLSYCLCLSRALLLFLCFSNFFRFVKQRKELSQYTAKQGWDELELI